MGSVARPLEILDEMFRGSIDLGILQCTAQDAHFDGRSIRINDKKLTHFGSCSYLGLELDPRLVQGGIDALRRYGAHFSSSRAYVSAPLYEELESLLGQIFGGHILVMPTTTLGHMAALPVLCEAEDALILDQQAHNSLHMAANQVRANGSHVEIVRHNDLERLDERVRALSVKHRQIWYVADGVYSMYGDLAPIDGITALLERHPRLHAYLDDAHGVSWYGRRGRGYVLDCVRETERLVVATTLGKCFGAGGAVVVVPNETWRRRVRNCGGPMIFSGPVPPPVLGSAIASARIHLSGELPALQERLQWRIQFCNSLLLERGLPVVSTTQVPIRFIGIGSPGAARRLASRLMDDGFFTNVSHFPAVPMKRAGLRFTITLHNSEQDIRGLVDALERRVPRVLEEDSTDVGAIRRAFRLDRRRPGQGARDSRATRQGGTDLRLEVHESISSLEAEEWNRCLGPRGSFDANGLAFLEEIFRENPDRANNWRFRYYLVRDATGAPVLATFFTMALWKDDMLAPPAVSQLAEARRASDPEYLTSMVYSMGSLLTEGNHLFLDRSRDWRGALALLLSAVKEHAEESAAASVILRDLPADDRELDALLTQHEFTKMPMPERMVLDVDWTSDAERISRLSPKARYHQRRQVLPWEHAYDVEVLGKRGRRPSGAELARFHQLYRNVRAQSLEINTFELPEKLFRCALEHPSWELVVLRPKPGKGRRRSREAVAVGACFVGGEQYVPMVLGLDYEYVRSRGLYRQCLLQAIRRAQHHGSRRVLFGMGATLEKRRFGARAEASALYLQVRDPRPLEALSELEAQAGA